MRIFIAAALVAFSFSTTAYADAPSLLARAMRDVGTNPTGWSHQWCGRQMSMWVGGGPNLAKAWASYGKPSSPKPGAIGVMNGHVGVVKEVQGNRVVLVSGNHAGKSGSRKVGVGSYPMSRFIAFREP